MKLLLSTLLIFFSAYTQTDAIASDTITLALDASRPHAKAKIIIPEGIGSISGNNVDIILNYKDPLLQTRFSELMTNHGDAPYVLAVVRTEEENNVMYHVYDAAALNTYYNKNSQQVLNHAFRDPLSNSEATCIEYFMVDPRDHSSSVIALATDLWDANGTNDKKTFASLLIDANTKDQFFLLGLAFEYGCGCIPNEVLAYRMYKLADQSKVHVQYCIWHILKNNQANLKDALDEKDKAIDRCQSLFLEIINNPGCTAELMAFALSLIVRNTIPLNLSQDAMQTALLVMKQLKILGRTKRPQVSDLKSSDPSKQDLAELSLIMDCLSARMQTPHV